MNSVIKQKLVVQKYGGATLATPEKIKAVARRIHKDSQTMQLIVVVSAMGKTTDDLIHLAYQVSELPSRRELDMLLTAGERISMSLMSMALNELDGHDELPRAISFTGSQAGILTDGSHVNARIKDIRPLRIEEELKKNHIIILAGFQGVSKESKEVTTLGRGGSDTTAIAIAAHFQAEYCEILKDVDSVYSADPHQVKKAFPLRQLTYDQLLEMTFWGAEVLHYRSVELAKQKNVKIYVGPASLSSSTHLIKSKSSEASEKNGKKSNDLKDCGGRDGRGGTWVVSQEALENQRRIGVQMFESAKILSINSHEQVLRMTFTKDLSLDYFTSQLNKKQIPYPQFLLIEKGVPTQTTADETFVAYITGPEEVVHSIQKKITQLDQQLFSSVTVTCTGVTSPDLNQRIMTQLNKHNIKIEKMIFSAMSISFILSQDLRAFTIKILHELIEEEAAES